MCQVKTLLCRTGHIILFRFDEKPVISVQVRHVRGQWSCAIERLFKGMCERLILAGKPKNLGSMEVVKEAQKLSSAQAEVHTLRMMTVISCNCLLQSTSFKVLPFALGFGAVSYP
jgi:hypothetical protein